ncbi:MAG TPA: hypothetical protein VF868_15470 [Bacteroidia bacterium]|jgi:hypothetical protein
MKAKLGVLILAAVFCFNSCKKEEDPEPVNPTPAGPVVYPNYSKLAIGNYWVYQRFNLDTSGNYTPTVIDSCYIANDTVIGGKTYFVYTEPYISGGTNTKLLRDSLHYILDMHRIIFSSQDFTSIFKTGYQVAMPINDTICRYESKMTERNLVVHQPAGTYITHTFITNYYMYPAYSNGGSTRYIYSRYAKDIGIVEESLPFFSSSPNYEIRQLLRYHVN